MEHPPAYRDLFSTYLLGSLRQSLARVEAHAYTMPEGDRVQAWHVLSYALAEEAEGAGAWVETKALLLALAPKMELAGFRHDWMRYLEQGATCARDSGDEEAVAELGLEMGLLWQRLGSYDDARRWLHEAERTFATRNDPPRRALALNRLADTAQQQGRLGEARRLVTKAMKLVAEDTPEHAHGLFVLGSVAFDNHQWEEAQHHFEQALAIWEEMGDARRAALSKQNLGRVYMAREKYDAAISYFEHAVEVFISLDDKVGFLAVQLNLGIAHYLCGRFAKALQSYTLAEEVARRVYNKNELAMLKNNRGLAYMKIQRWTEAKQDFHASISLWHKLGHEAARLNAIDGLGLTLIGQNRYEEAASLCEEALVELERIGGEQQYKRLHEKLTSHLQQAKEGALPVEQHSLALA